MRMNLNTVLLLVAILLLAYIAFLKPQPQRFASTVSYYLLVDTATGRLCDARTPSNEAIEEAELEIELLEEISTSPSPGYPRQGQLEMELQQSQVAIQAAKDALYNLLHPSKRYPLCSDL